MPRQNALKVLGTGPSNTSFFWAVGLMEDI